MLHTYRALTKTVVSYVTIEWNTPGCDRGADGPALKRASTTVGIGNWGDCPVRRV